MKQSLPKPKSLKAIFAKDNPYDFVIELTRHCHEKMDLGQPLTEAERTYDLLRELGRNIANEGFLSVFNEYLTQESFSVICGALAEVGAEKLRGLLLEAWSIYTNDRTEMTPAELRAIPRRHFNTAEKMARFEQIGTEVEAERATQAETKKFWAVEYARLHRDEFAPIAPAQG